MPFIYEACRNQFFLEGQRAIKIEVIHEMLELLVLFTGHGVIIVSRSRP